MQGMSTTEGFNYMGNFKGLKTKSIVTLIILVGGIIQIFSRAIKELTSSDLKHHQDLEVRMHNNLNLNLNFIMTKVHLWELQWKARWRNSWI